MKIKYYKDKGSWYWYVYSNGTILAFSGRGYKRLADAKKAFQKLDRLF